MIQTALPYIGDAATVPIHLIETTAQIRTRNGFDEESLRELADTIRQHGLLQPLVVRRTGAETYALIAGERRLIACSIAGLAEVPVLVRVANDEEVPAIQAVENLQRVDLGLLDRADGVRALVDKIGAKRTASMLGKSPAWVSKHLAVTKMHADVRNVAASGMCEDVEVLGTLKQIRSRSADAFDKACASIEAGTASRDSLRSALEMLKKPAPHAAEDEDDDGSHTPIEKFGKLELGQEQAQMLSAAMRQLKPTSAPAYPPSAVEALQGHLAAFIAKTWQA